jgi:hypothetical protein
MGAAQQRPAPANETQQLAATTAARATARPRATARQRRPGRRNKKKLPLLISALQENPDGTGSTGRPGTLAAN